MDYVELGRTGLKVSVAGLGTGGHSKLGQGQGLSVEHSVNLVHAAIDLGINVIDVSNTGPIEPIVGRAIEDRRDGLVVTTKLHPVRESGAFIDAAALRDYVEAALGRLRTEVIDIFYLHGLSEQHYDFAMAELLPEMQRLRERGLIRFTGVTEDWGNRTDYEHRMLARAIADGCWDVVMVGYNLLHHVAARNVFPPAQARGIGTMVMYAVRDVLSRPGLLQATLREAVELGLLAPEGIDLGDPLGFLVHEGGATSVIDAAYRFARHTSGVHTVLTGTGSLEHLRSNVASICSGPLPRADVERLAKLFGHLTHITGNAKERFAEQRRRFKEMGM